MQPTVILANAVTDITTRFGVDSEHFFSQVISFCIVTFLLYKFAYDPILKMLAERRQRIADSMANADKIKAELARTEAVQSGVTVELLREYQARDDSGILVAELGGEVVGMLSFFVRPGLFHGGHWGYVDELIVTATAQGKGIGDALMSAVMSRFEAAGCVEAAVSTVFGNDRAAALYRKHGLVDEALQLEKHF